MSAGREEGLPLRELIPALWRLSRPQGAAWLCFVVFIGYAFSLWDWGRRLVDPVGLVLVLVAWWLGSAGALWLNAALDVDDGAVLFQRENVMRRPSRGQLHGATLVVGAISATLAAFAHPVAGAFAVVNGVLAWLYSGAHTRWKANPVLGPLVNVVGYGFLTPVAGHLVSGVPATLRQKVTLGLLALWMLGAFFAAQAFQREEDAARGYRTLVVTHGPRVTLRAALVCMGGAMIGVLLLTAWGYYPRLCLLATPAFALALVFLWRWQRDAANPRDVAEAGARRAMLLFAHMLGAGLFYFGLAYVEYRIDRAAGRPAAGWATERGNPDPYMLVRPVRRATP